MSTQLLNMALQKKLRQSVRFNLNDIEFGGKYNTTIFVGPRGMFLGEWCATPQEARQCAIDHVLCELEKTPEHDFRQTCDLPQRFHLDELDKVRDQLRALRQRVKGRYQSNHASTEIGKLYAAVDRCEHEVMLSTGEYDFKSE